MLAMYTLRLEWVGVRKWRMHDGGNGLLVVRSRIGGKRSVENSVTELSGRLCPVNVSAPHLYSSTVPQHDSATGRLPETGPKPPSSGMVTSHVQKSSRHHCVNFSSFIPWLVISRCLHFYYRIVNIITDDYRKSFKNTIGSYPSN